MCQTGRGFLDTVKTEGLGVGGGGGGGGGRTKGEGVIKRRKKKTPRFFNIYLDVDIYVW